MTRPDGNRPSDAWLALMGRAPKRIPHWEHMSNPDFIGLVSAIDPYQHPQAAALKARELYPFVGVSVPESDDPVPRPADGVTANGNGRLRTRWGSGTTSYWDWGARFHTIEEVLAYEPLEHLDLHEGNIVENRDYSVSEDELFRHYGGKPEEDGTAPPQGEVRGAGFYNTMFMWPLLTFGWGLFLELAGGHKDHLRRLLEDFAAINRNVFRVFARLPVNQIVCHDDICCTRGPVCSPAWLREFIYPYYEELFSIAKSGEGERRVIFMSDGNIDAVADDVKACGADGFVSEPMTDWKAIARKYPTAPIAGEGDNRILMRNVRDEIEAMVRRMVETAKISGGYYMCVGNHIPWNVPPEAVKLYFDLSQQLASRE